jgi:hypothetical protein
MSTINGATDGNKSLHLNGTVGPITPLVIPVVTYQDRGATKEGIVGKMERVRELDTLINNNNNNNKK